MSENENINVYKKYLPIGTVVMLNNAKKGVMITGYCAIDGKELTDKDNFEIDKMYDYSGCLWPEGIVKSDQMLLFNHDQIKQIIYIGYVDAQFQTFNNNLNKTIAELTNNIPKRDKNDDIELLDI